MKNKVIKGSIFIALGASCYALLAPISKLAYQEGFSTAEITLSQFIIGFAGLLLLTLFHKRESLPETPTSGIKSSVKLIVAGTSLGLTSIFYYKSVQYIQVSAAIVLLMQTVWMGVILEMILKKKLPGLRKIVSVIIILTGTILAATNLLKESIQINWKGFGWGMMAALSYTVTMNSSNNIELNFPPLKRSLYMTLGGLIVSALIFHSSLNLDFSFDILLRWGFFLAIFGSILPTILFMRGMPLTGMGLGAIIAAVEIPVAALMANILLNEPVSLLQWIGVILILAAVALMNIGFIPQLINNKKQFMKNAFKIPQLLLRLALGIGFLVTVSDRLGFLGPYGTRNIEWGNWDSFINYTGTLMPFLDKPAVNVMGGIATLAEAVIGILLILGFKTRIVAIGSCLLTLVFAFAMSIFLGIKAPINFAVFPVCTASLLLATIPAYNWSIDHFFALRHAISR
jgi:drug/metabolite transporter (DMT)-like permease/uncharacterized membrane protein YphA (DoxX/SURF4 family)